MSVAPLNLDPVKALMKAAWMAGDQGIFAKYFEPGAGYTFRPRTSKSRQGRYFVNFSPAISSREAKSIRETMRQWRMHRYSDKSLEDLARISNPVIRGWINYYGCFYKSAMYPIFQTLNNILARWASRKYKRLRGRKRRSHRRLQRIAHGQPCLFAHWQLSQLKAGQ